MRPVLSLLAAAFVAPAQEGVVFQTDVSLVQVDAQVTTADGRIIDNLEREDFRVLDERKEQKILHFSAGEESLDLILLFDISGSMRPIVQAVGQAAREGLRELREGDRVAVMTFNTRTRLIAPFTEDLDAVERTVLDLVLSIRFGGGTLIQSAADEAALWFQKEKRGRRRRAVLIITDNVGIRTRRESTVVRNYWEADAILSGLIVNNAATRALNTAGTVMAPQMLIMRAGMKGIAEKTGGDAITAGDPGAGFTNSMRRIRSRYTLYYAMPPAKSGETRSIRVELAPEATKLYPKARVRARTGYVAR